MTLSSAVSIAACSSVPVPDTIRLPVSSDPSGAAVYLNSTRVGFTPDTLELRSAHHYRLDLRRAGHDARSFLLMNKGGRWLAIDLATEEYDVATEGLRVELSPREGMALDTLPDSTADRQFTLDIQRQIQTDTTKKRANPWLEQGYFMAFGLGFSLDTETKNSIGFGGEVAIGYKHKLWLGYTLGVLGATGYDVTGVREAGTLYSDGTVNTYYLGARLSPYLPIVYGTAGFAMIHAHCDSVWSSRYWWDTDRDGWQGFDRLLPGWFVGVGADFIAGYVEARWTYGLSDIEWRHPEHSLTISLPVAFATIRLGVKITELMVGFDRNDR